MDSLEKMFGFIFVQPIHKTLRQMRIATVILLYCSMDIMYRLIRILESSNQLSTEQTVGAVGVLAAAVFATVWKGIQNLQDAQKDDD
jgi:hypothetical protein